MSKAGYGCHETEEMGRVCHRRRAGASKPVLYTLPSENGPHTAPTCTTRARAAAVHVLFPSPSDRCGPRLRCLDRATAQLALRALGEVAAAAAQHMAVKPLLRCGGPEVPCPTTHFVYFIA
eukprot:351375-Chlamydomonas_euryale.AAC.23